MKHPRFTKEVAARLCAELWEWLAEHPEMEKSGFPYWREWKEIYGINFSRQSRCPACAYVLSPKKPPEDPCKKCPLLHIWPGPRRCLGPDSPFKEWDSSLNHNERKLFATIIATAAREVEMKCKMKRERRKNR